ncbi:MAG: bifunctional 3-(3-hydroxy-phenyl)propionate/3-hydroxycinnamic acid hydroxylase [Acidimicrobiales bacterium]
MGSTSDGAGPFDVAIVGYGPVGTTLAILLAQLGRRVVVLERWSEPYALPRAVHFDHEAARILQACGLGTELVAISEPAEVYEWRNRAGATLLRFGRVGPGVSGWPESSMFNQPELEASLDRRARGLPAIEIRRGVEVIALNDDPDVDAVTVGSTAASGSSAVRARYVVGCDGANSTVRTLVDAPVTDLGFFYDWLIVDVVLDHERAFDPINLQICDPARPTTAVSGGPGRRRWEFMRLPHETLDELNREATAWRLLQGWGVTPDNATLERHAVYTFQARWVQRWRTGRVLLAGDAAHQMPPFAGQGLCSGLRDAMNLAWKLDLVLGGHAPDLLLDTYGEERAANACAVIAFSMVLGKIICVDDLGEAEQRDAAMTAAVPETGLAAVPPLPGIGAGLLDDTPHAGRLFIQGQVGRDGRRGRFDDIVGTGWRLVGRAGHEPVIDAELAAWFAGIGGQIVTVGAGGELDDPDGGYATWFADHDVIAALQRPDFYLYGTAVDDEDRSTCWPSCVLTSRTRQIGPRGRSLKRTCRGCCRMSATTTTGSALVIAPVPVPLPWDPGHEAGPQVGARMGGCGQDDAPVADAAVAHPGPERQPARHRPLSHPGQGPQGRRRGEHRDPVGPPAPDLGCDDRRRGERHHRSAAPISTAGRSASWAARRQGRAISS